LQAAIAEREQLDDAGRRTMTASPTPRLALCRRSSIRAR